MNTLMGNWTGKIIGTNNGDIFFEIMESNSQLTGTVRINDPIYGPAVYNFQGNRNGDSLSLELDSVTYTGAQFRTHTAFVDGRKVN